MIEKEQIMSDKQKQPTEQTVSQKHERDADAAGKSEAQVKDLEANKDVKGGKRPPSD